MEDSDIFCTECNAKIKPGSKFCTECGKPVEETKTDTLQASGTDETEVSNSDSEPGIRCPQCNNQLKADETFCTECGTKIEIITDCPKCGAPIQPGTSFCTECGTNIYEYKSSEAKTSSIQTGSKITEVPQTAQSSSDDDPLDNIIKDVEKTGRGLMKDLGGLLDKSSKKSSEKTIKPARKDQKFLVCNQCGGYYQLQSGESPEDFSLECDCGGKLEVKNKHPKIFLLIPILL